MPVRLVWLLIAVARLLRSFAIISALISTGSKLTLSKPKDTLPALLNSDSSRRIIASAVISVFVSTVFSFAAASAAEAPPWSVMLWTWPSPCWTATIWSIADEAGIRPIPAAAVAPIPFAPVRKTLKPAARLI